MKSVISRLIQCICTPEDLSICSTASRNHSKTSICEENWWRKTHTYRVLACSTLYSYVLVGTCQTSWEREKRKLLTCHGQDGVCTRGRESGVWVTLTPPCCLVECYHSLTPPMALVRGWQAYGHGIVCRLGWPRGEVSTAGSPCFIALCAVMPCRAWSGQLWWVGGCVVVRLNALDPPPGSVSLKLVLPPCISCWPASGAALGAMLLIKG